jgi:site-specific DNA-cytosine methylase
MLTSLDLFSCIGNHAIGFSRAGIDTVAMCEINPWRRERLYENFYGVRIYEDVKKLNYHKADIVIGGPPCQQTSVASAIHGKRSGESLWSEMLRIGLSMDAEWVVVEQPPGFAAWEAQVADDLSRAGRHVSRIEFAACDIGAPYLRRRVFLVACTSLSRLEVAWKAIPSAIASVKRAANARGDWNTDQLASIQVDARSAGEFDGSSKERKQWIEALGDSNPPHMAEVIGRCIQSAMQ